MEALLHSKDKSVPWHYNYAKPIFIPASLKAKANLAFMPIQLAMTTTSIHKASTNLAPQDHRH
eukprot:SAG31_NODE_651_length_13184_cov_4.999541_10_plen_63_part_00